MSNTQVVQPEILKSLAYTSITTSYVAVGSAYSNPIRIMTLVNNTDADMIFSLDGINAHFFVPKSSFRLYDFATNRLNVDQIFAVQTGTQVYVKYSSMPGSGSVYVEGIYGVKIYSIPGGN